MMRIDAISEQPDRAGRYRLSLSDGTTLRLYPQTVADFGLFSGRVLSQQEWESLRQEAGCISARMRSVRIVSASAVSSRDLTRRLVQKGETPEDARQAVAWMEDLGLVDDRETARQVVSRGLNRGYGKSRLRQMLYEKQIPRELWEEALEDLPEPDEAIQHFLEKRLAPGAGPKETKKAVDALMRRGFSWQDIRRVLYARGCDSEGEPEE